MASCSFNFQQLLHSLNKDPKLPSPIETFFGGKVCYAGDSKFCLILSGRISQPTWSLGVATFDVKFKTSDGGGIHFYHENPLCYHQFDDLESYMSNLPQSEDNHNIPRLYDYETFSDAFVIFMVQYACMDVPSKKEKEEGPSNLRASARKRKREADSQIAWKQIMMG
ncbi:hypothetical protein M0R45_008289 [Rubus argutus]|uniref:Uncharacterized protein n=1 Tax=Rubus argutus TaxID=59490 RepID=A0AAW1Y0Z4_RUBAR